MFESRVSVSVRRLLLYSMDPLSWMRVAPRLRRETSTWMVTGFTKYWSEPADVIACLMLSTADWCSGPRWKSLLFLVRSYRDREARLGTNRLRNCVRPRKDCRSARFEEGSIFEIASIFCRSILRPLALMM